MREHSPGEQKKITQKSTVTFHRFPSWRTGWIIANFKQKWCKLLNWQGRQQRAIKAFSPSQRQSDASFRLNRFLRCQEQETCNCQRFNFIFLNILSSHYPGLEGHDPSSARKPPCCTIGIIVATLINAYISFTSIHFCWFLYFGYHANCGLNIHPIMKAN